MGAIQLKSFFVNIEFDPSSNIYSLFEAYEGDDNPHKVNLNMGVFRTEESQPYVLPVVRKVEADIIASPHMNHEYTPLYGLPNFTKAAVELMLGKDSPAVIENRAHGIQTISGAGALRLGAEFLSNVLGFKRVFMSNPTWDNHRKIFESAGFKVIQSYRYWNPKTYSVDIEGMLDDLEKAPDASVVLLHVCAHNPTGCDPTREQWISIANVIERKKHFVFFDSAYQGFASDDLDKDAFSVRHFAYRGLEMLCAQSFSKNLGLYGERVGNLIIVHRDPSTMASAMGKLASIAYYMYAFPPKHGALIVQTILNDVDLHAEWLRNIKVMTGRIKSIRLSLYNELIRLKTPGSWNHIVDQIGMFWYSGLSEEQVQFLIEKYHIYLRKTGRISLCGLNNNNVAYVATAIHAAVTTIPR